MSYTEIFGFTKKGNAVHIGDVQNGHRSAASIWMYLENKYLPKLNEYKYSTRIVSMDLIQEVWDLMDTKIELHERIVLGSTFDRMIIMNTDVEKLVDAYYKFEGITSLKEQADMIKQFSDTGKYIAFGINQISCNGDTWCRYYINGKTRKYNVLKYNEHFDLFSDVRIADYENYNLRNL